MIEIPDLSVPVERASRIRDFEERICQAGKERLETGKDGLQVAAKLAGYRIGLLKALYDSADPPSSLALLVTGGLGRNIASPYSDFDLVFLRGSLTDEDIEAFLQRFLYPLWDAGLTVGHTVHTAASYLDLALEDLTVLTSVLDRHSVAGNEALTDELDRLADARLREEPFRQAMLQAVRTWTDGINSATAHRLEPDIKSGAGGLRTLHEVWWAARFVWNINSWRDLPNNDLLEAHDVEVLMYGFRLLLEVRLALHFEAGRRQDSLRFEFQSRVAERLGVGDDAHDLASANRLLSVVYRTKRAIRSAADRALEVCLEALLADGDTLGLESGSMTNERYGQLVFDPVGDESSITAESVMALFGEAQRQDKPIHWTARTRISELGPTLFTPEACTSPAVADLFMEIIATSDDQGATLEAIHEAGILERLLPEFVPVT
ncbi:MAG: hypothetical protein VX834_07630, partial [Myxococcota bacterium]|nr:hypothetical protein [Myxococcota bacterium]